MKKNEIMKSVGLTFNKIGFQIQKKSPELLVAAGIAGAVVNGGSVLIGAGGVSAAAAGQQAREHQCAEGQRKKSLPGFHVSEPV